MSYFIESIPTGPETEVVVSVPNDWQLPMLAIRHKEQALSVALDPMEARLVILALQLALREAEKTP